MLQIKNVSKHFGEVKALDSVNLEFPETGVVGLLGPNGAGKTTLMRIITGYMTSKTGMIKWDGKKINPTSSKHKKRIGYLPENNPIYGQMVVLDYLKFIAELKEVEDIEGALVKVIKSCGLKSVVDRKIETLSKGFRQRVGLAGAIIGQPKILILDEPTTGLDPNQIMEIRQLIKSLGNKRLVILSTHILPEAREICERIVMINYGKVVLDSETSKIIDLEKKFVELTS